MNWLHLWQNTVNYSSSGENNRRILIPITDKIHFAHSFMTTFKISWRNDIMQSQFNSASGPLKHVSLLKSTCMIFGITWNIFQLVSNENIWFVQQNNHIVGEMCVNTHEALRAVLNLPDSPLSGRPPFWFWFCHWCERGRQHKGCRSLKKL